ncbi:MAG: prenyltransferase/squalene oxidase repeat-containing protein [Candidatus Parabeggiatoa sp.]|nr:prenyltransferase/squalene oxidase repeat-containing protein [Candidatus Parabeggiatoa sp.]
MSATFGVNWLASQTHQGGISTPNDVAIGFQSTAEALRTFHALNEEEALKNIMAIGQEALNAVSYHSTESLSRQIIAGHENGDDISAQVNELLALQNPDGGFGEMADFDSTVLNTAFALEALAMAAPSETQTTERALTFLTQHQNPSGSFVLNAVNESAIYVTALASSALQRFLFKQQLLPYVEAANDYLYKNQIEGGGWETDWETAIALLAVASATADTSFYKPAAQVLRTHQDNKGSWGEDAYTTALALRALQYVKRIQFPVEPDKGILTGQIVDDNSGLPLEGV